MSNDLISRSAAIENIWSLYNNIYNNASVFEKEETQFASRILTYVQRTIENLPAAYDVDKVVRQLYENSYEQFWHIKNISTELAVEIIKAGGVHE